MGEVDQPRPEPTISPDLSRNLAPAFAWKMVVVQASRARLHADGSDRGKFIQCVTPAPSARRYPSQLPSCSVPFPAWKRAKPLIASPAEAPIRPIFAASTAKRLVATTR